MAEETPAAVVAQPVSAQIVANAFVAQYYSILHHSPDILHRFYKDISRLGRPEDDGNMSITTTMAAINEKILSLNYGEFGAEIKSVDAQESLNMGVHVLVTGYLTGMDNMRRDFTQSFFLAPQEKGYFVLNDMFRYVEKVNNYDENQVFVKGEEAPEAPEQESPEAEPVQEDHISEQTDLLAEETSGKEVPNPSENGEVELVEVEVPRSSENQEVEVMEEKEVPLAEAVDAVPDDPKPVVESNFKIEEVPKKMEEVPKKSYASIVMDLKESAVPFLPPVPAVCTTQPKSQEKQENPEVSVSSLDASENGNNQEGEGEGYSIYIKSLPYNATLASVEEEFKRFGAIKTGGIQVIGRDGFCFGFVEFEEASAVQKAIEASPIKMGGRNAVIEEKKSPNSRGNHYGRLRNEAGLRNEGMRGRDNYVTGRGGYSRGEFNGRSEFGDRANNRGRGGGGGYQRAENVGGRVNRVSRLGGSGMPRVHATA